MTSYYLVSGRNDDILGVAYTVEKVGQIFLPGPGPVENWVERVFELRQGTFSDHLSTNFASRVCSERLRAILDSLASEDDKLQWLRIKVRSAEEELPYFILHFPEPPDVLEKEACILFDGQLVKPVFSRERLARHNVFTYPGKYVHSLFVSDGVKRSIESAGCTGIQFSRAPVK
jgi:hypothetical protein